MRDSTQHVFYTSKPSSRYTSYEDSTVIIAACCIYFILSLKLKMGRMRSRMKLNWIVAIEKIVRSNIFSNDFWTPTEPSDFMSWTKKFDFFSDFC